MKSGKIICCFFLVSFFLVSACQDGDESKSKKGDYSGVSNLIADRNKARYETVEKPSQRKTAKTVSTSKSRKEQSKPKKEELATAILYEQKVKIVGSDSGRTLAKGVAYVNKKGQIVRIKLIKE